MGLFSKIKNMFQKTEETVIEKNEVVENESSFDIEEELKDNFSDSRKENFVEDVETKKEEVKKSVKVYEKGLTKSRQGFVSKLANLTNKYNKVNEEYFEELEEILIMADIGVNTVMDLIDKLRDRVKKEGIVQPDELKEIIVDELFITYVNDEVLSSKINYAEDGPTVLLFVGVNGVGKTTTIGKLAWNLKEQGKKVLLVGADTFRAGAVSQLKEWSEKIDVGFYGKDQGADPASVVYDGLKMAKEESYDVVLVDTAGRLQNKFNLMQELQKIKGVIDKNANESLRETILVLDANTGQNGLSQAKIFMESVNVTCVALTKLDGSSKGGIIISIAKKFNLPVKLIGVGEKMQDLKDFDSQTFIDALFTK